MRLYKLTGADGKTRDNTQWGENVTHELPVIDNPKLCVAGLLHAYRTPTHAVMMALEYGYAAGQLWEAEGEVVADDGTKVGCFRLTTIRKIDMPTLTTERRVEIAIRCSLLVYRDPQYVAWAESWLTGTDRSAAAATAAWAAAAATARSAAATWAAAAVAAAAVAVGAASAADINAIFEAEDKPCQQ